MFRASAVMDVAEFEMKLLESMTLTENMSPAFSTTSSHVLDFFYEAMQGSSQDLIEEKISKSWAEDPLITLKVAFQLRDIRNGKGALKEFHYCLIWLHRHHPGTLVANLPEVASHGYWKDLSLLVKFLLMDQVSLTTKKTPRTSRGLVFENSSAPAGDLDRLALERVQGKLSRKSWLRYLKNQFPSLESRQEARKRLSIIADSYHKEQSREAKKRRSRDSSSASNRVLQLLDQDSNFKLLYDAVVSLFCSALRQDSEVLRQGKELGKDRLAGKWAPTIGCSIDSTTCLGKRIALSLCEPRPKESPAEYELRARLSYRTQYLTPLRSAISVPESFMSRKKWSDLPYERVPSVCMKRSKELFLEKDRPRFTEFIDAAFSGKKKLASGALLPHEIIKEMRSSTKEQVLENVCQLQWDSYVSRLRESGLFDSALSICDVSGSMEGVPMNVAIALSLLTSELSKPPFRDLICTFSESPELHKLPPDGSLRQRVESIAGANWGMNTNMQAVFDLLLDLAVTCSLPDEDMVRTLFIFSDMQFDCCGGQEFETDFALISRKFRQAGYSMPAIVFWNLRSDCRTMPVQKAEFNVALVSGFSGNMLKYFLESGTFESPYQVMLTTLQGHYDGLKVVD